MLGIVFIERFIKRRILDRIDSQRICSCFLDQLKPVQIGFFGDRIICRPFTWNTASHVNSSDFKWFPLIFVLYKYLFILSLDKCVYMIVPV